MPALFSHTSPMPFGRYKNKQMQQIPAVYLLLLYDRKCKHAGVKQYVEMEYQRLVKDAGNKRIKITH